MPVRGPKDMTGEMLLRMTLAEHCLVDNFWSFQCLFEL